MGLVSGIMIKNAFNGYLTGAGKLQGVKKSKGLQQFDTILSASFDLRDQDIVALGSAGFRVGDVIEPHRDREAAVLTQADFAFLWQFHEIISRLVNFNHPSAATTASRGQAGTFPEIKAGDFSLVFKYSLIFVALRHGQGKNANPGKKDPVTHVLML